MDRSELERAWLRLTREVLPRLARVRNWPVSEDHCFQRIFLDAVCGGVWYQRVSGRPAYRHLSIDSLEEAVALAEAVRRGDICLDGLNRQSLGWRREQRHLKDGSGRSALPVA
jgi:hypothetical protein